MAGPRQSVRPFVFEYPVTDELVIARWTQLHSDIGFAVMESCNDEVSVKKLSHAMEERFAEMSPVWRECIVDAGSLASVLTSFLWDVLRTSVFGDFGGISSENGAMERRFHPSMHGDSSSLQSSDATDLLEKAKKWSKGNREAVVKALARRREAAAAMGSGSGTGTPTGFQGAGPSQPASMWLQKLPIRDGQQFQCNRTEIQRLLGLHKQIMLLWTNFQVPSETFVGKLLDILIGAAEVAAIFDACSPNDGSSPSGSEASVVDTSSSTTPTSKGKRPATRGAVWNIRDVSVPRTDASDSPATCTMRYDPLLMEPTNAGMYLRHLAKGTIPRLRQTHMDTAYRVVGPDTQLNAQAQVVELVVKPGLVRRGLFEGEQPHPFVETVVVRSKVRLSRDLGSQTKQEQDWGSPYPGGRSFPQE